MDDARIRELRGGGAGPARRDAAGRGEPSGLEARVAALEAAVARASAGARGRAARAAAAPRAASASIPACTCSTSPGGGDRCVLEPDKPCVQSHACRTFGH